jgi:hypothetical protein
MSLTIHSHDGGQPLVEGVFGGDCTPQRLVGVRWWGEEVRMRGWGAGLVGLEGMSTVPPVSTY